MSSAGLGKIQKIKIYLSISSKFSKLSNKPLNFKFILILLSYIQFCILRWNSGTVLVMIKHSQFKSECCTILWSDANPNRISSNVSHWIVFTYFHPFHLYFWKSQWQSHLWLESSVQSIRNDALKACCEEIQLHYYQPSVSHP